MAMLVKFLVIITEDGSRWPRLIFLTATCIRDARIKALSESELLQGAISIDVHVLDDDMLSAVMPTP